MFVDRAIAACQRRSRACDADRMLASFSHCVHDCLKQRSAQYTCNGCVYLFLQACKLLSSLVKENSFGIDHGKGTGGRAAGAGARQTGLAPLVSGYNCHPPRAASQASCTKSPSLSEYSLHLPHPCVTVRFLLNRTRFSMQYGRDLNSLGVFAGRGSKHHNIRADGREVGGPTAVELG